MDVDLTRIVKSLRRSVVQVRPGESGGAGVVVRGQDGELVILTNAHVVRGEVGSVVSIVTETGTELQARIRRLDRKRDLGYLTPDPLSMNGEGPLFPATVGNVGALRPGQLVVAVGHPFGLANAVTTGVVHCVGPLGFSMRWDGGAGDRSWVQADIRLAPGNSGGPLADVEGRVVGINTMVAGGLALAVPISEVEL